MAHIIGLVYGSYNFLSHRIMRLGKFKQVSTLLGTHPDSDTWLRPMLEGNASDWHRTGQMAWSMLSQNDHCSEGSWQLSGTVTGVLNQSGPGSSSYRILELRRTLEIHWIQSSHSTDGGTDAWSKVTYPKSPSQLALKPRQDLRSSDC